MFRVLTADMTTAALGFIVGCVFLAQLHRFFVVVPAPIAFDEGYTAALAQRMTEGRWLPYVDGCSHRGPLLYWASALFQAKAGAGSWLGMRWMSLVLCFATAGGTFAAAASVGRPLAGAIAVLIYAYVLSVYHTASSFGILGETISSPLVVLAIACAGFGLARAKRARSTAVWLALAGVFSSLAGLAKQTSLPIIGPIALWTALQLWRDPASERRTKLWLGLALGGGFALPVVVTLARYLAAGELATFWYWYYRYNAEVYMAPFRGFKAKTAFDMLPAREHWPLLILVVAMVGSFTAWLAGVGQRTADALARVRRGFDLTLLLVTLLVFAGSIAPLRYFYHYFVPLFPLGALLCGVAIERAIDGAGGSPRYRFVARLACVAGVAALTLFVSDHRLRTLRNERERGSWGPRTPEPVCDYLGKHADASAPVFIWGFDADLYVTCKRRAASRFLYLTLVAGNVPGAWWGSPRPEGVAEGSRALLMKDLEQSKPPVILEIVSTMSGVSMATVPELSTWVNQAYAKQPVIATKDGRSVTPWLRTAAPPAP